MLVILVACGGLTLAILPALITSSTYSPDRMFKNIQVVTQTVHFWCTVSLCTVSLWFIWKRQQWKNSGTIVFLAQDELSICNNHQNSYSNESTFENNVTVSAANMVNGQQIYSMYHTVPYFQIVIFGIGCGLWLLCKVVHILFFDLDEEMSFGYREVMDVTDNSIYLVLILIQIIFFTKFDNVVFPNKRLFHYSFAMMIADKMWVWLLVTLRHYVKLSSGGENCTHEENHQNNTGNSTILSPFHTAINMSLLFLEPFFLEFLNLSVCVLFHLWNLSGTNVTRQNVGSGRDAMSGAGTYPQERRLRCIRRIRPISDNLSEIDPQRETLLSRSENKGHNHDNRRKNVLDLFLVGVSIIFFLFVGAGILVTNLLLTLNEFNDFVKPLKGNQNYLYRGIQIVGFLPAVIICPIVSYKLNKNTRHSSSSNTNYLLLFTASSSFIWFILRFTATADIIFSNKETISQLFLQT